jgi:hypothetical protein
MHTILFDTGEPSRPKVRFQTQFELCDGRKIGPRAASKYSEQGHVMDAGSIGRVTDAPLADSRPEVESELTRYFTDRISGLCLWPFRREITGLRALGPGHEASVDQSKGGRS